MSAEEREGLVAGLDPADVPAVQALAELCNAEEQLNLVLGLEPAPAGQTGHFLHYQHGQLAGFASLWSHELPELNIMVHPAQRRRGIGRALFNAAAYEARGRGADRLLLICEERSQSGRAFASALGASFRFAEYGMALQPAALPERPERWEIVLRPAGQADGELLSQLTAESFEDPLEHVRPMIERWLSEPGQRFYLGTLGDQPVGSMRVILDPPPASIYTFGVLPRYRRRGYGRQMLLQAAHLLVAEGHQPITLDVETENRSALALYEGCGFRETAVYGYYELEL